MADENQLSDGRPAGTMVGQDASDKVALHGATPTVQSSSITSLSTTTYVGTTTPTTVFGFTSSAEVLSLLSAVNSLITACRAKGIIAS
jgi:hypothetical protein